MKTADKFKALKLINDLYTLIEGEAAKNLTFGDGLTLLLRFTDTIEKEVNQE
jgi:hypothetical protein